MQELARQQSTLIRRKLAAGVESVNSAERAVAAAMVQHFLMLLPTPALDTVFSILCGNMLVIRFLLIFSPLLSSTQVKHSGFVALARRFARAFASSPVKGNTPKPPFGLLKLWRSARRARKWIKLKKDSHIVRGGIADYDRWANTVKERVRGHCGHCVCGCMI